MTWSLTEAQNRLSELVTLVLTEGPQRVRRRTEAEAVVVISAAEYERLSARRPSFKQYLQQGPPFDALDLSRDQHPGRDVNL